MPRHLANRARCATAGTYGILHDSLLAGTRTACVEKVLVGNDAVLDTNGLQRSAESNNGMPERAGSICAQHANQGFGRGMPGEL